VPANPHRSPEGNHSPERPDSSQEVRTSSPLRVVRDLASPSQSNVQQNVQTMNELARLSLSPEGRKTIDALAENRQLPTSKAKLDINTYFRNTFVSIMEKKGIFDFSSNEPLPFDRNAPIHQVREYYGEEAAIALIVSHGKVTEKKSEQAAYREDIPETFKEYDNKATRVMDSLFEVKSDSERFGRFKGSIDPGKDSSITFIDAARERDPKALFLGEVAGELWLYVLSKIKSGKDDADMAVNMDVSQLSKYPKKLSGKRINNTETRARMRLLLKGKVHKAGTIAIAKDSGGIWALDDNSTIKTSFTQEEAQNLAWGILGTPIGYATAFLPKQYKHVFGDIENTRIELKFGYNSSDAIDIDEMHFYFDEKRA